MPKKPKKTNEPVVFRHTQSFKDSPPAIEPILKVSKRSKARLDAKKLAKEIKTHGSSMD